MKLKLVALLLIGIAMGWGVHWFLVTDACYDAGGYWEPHGSFCYGARPAHPNAELQHP